MTVPQPRRPAVNADESTSDSTADLVLVVDFGAQYAQLIARRVRESRVYSEIVPHDTPYEEILARRPKAVILSGGPSSVYAPGRTPLAPVDGGGVLGLTGRTVWMSHGDAVSAAPPGFAVTASTADSPVAAF